MLRSRELIRYCIIYVCYWYIYLFPINLTIFFNIFLFLVKCEKYLPYSWRKIRVVSLGVLWCYCRYARIIFLWTYWWFLNPFPNCQGATYSHKKIFLLIYLLKLSRCEVIQLSKRTTPFRKSTSSNITVQVDTVTKEDPIVSLNYLSSKLKELQSEVGTIYSFQFSFRLIYACKDSIFHPYTLFL